MTNPADFVNELVNQGFYCANGIRTCTLNLGWWKSSQNWPEKSSEFCSVA